MHVLVVILLAVQAIFAPLMLDRSRISLPQLEIHPALVANPDQFAAEHNLPLLEWQPKPTRRTKDGKPRHTAKLSPFADDALVIWAVRSGRRYFAYLLEFNPAKLLYGHNGVPLGSPYRLCEALSELHAWVAILLRKQAYSDYVIPGLKRGSGAYWSTLEILIHLLDPDGRLLHAFSNCSHASIRKQAFDVSGESRKLRGSLMAVSIYRKDLELERLARKFEVHTALPSILRVEYTLSGTKLQSYFGTGEGKLTSFTFDDLRRVHAKITSELRGVFYLPDPRSTKATVNAQFIAAQVLKGRASADELISDYVAVSGCNRNTLSTLRRDVRTLLEQASPIQVGKIAGIDAFRNQPEIRIPKLESSTAANRLSRQPSRRILEVYGQGDLCGEAFIPHVVSTDLEVPF